MSVPNTQTVNKVVVDIVNVAHPGYQSFTESTSNVIETCIMVLTAIIKTILLPTISKQSMELKPNIKIKITNNKSLYCHIKP